MLEIESFFGKLRETDEFFELQPKVVNLRAIKEEDKFSDLRIYFKASSKNLRKFPPKLTFWLIGASIQNPCQNFRHKKLAWSDR
jgi:hypothetical protein